MNSVLPDTSVWIPWLRLGNPTRVRQAAGAGAVVWLSAVSVQELYAGARGKHQEAVQSIAGEFARAGRVLVPDLSDWKKTGLVLAQVAERFGYEQIGRNRLSNDALIAATAARHQLLLLTANPRDFARLAEFLPFEWRVAAG
jgi:predicted nucleic acid-binding protein